MDPFKRLSFPSFWPPRLCMIQAKELDPIELLPTNSAPRPLLSQIWEPATRGCSCVACLELPWNYKELSSQGYSTETCKAYMFLRPEEQLGKFWREEHNPFSNWILAYLALGSSSRLCLSMSFSFCRYPGILWDPMWRSKECCTSKPFTGLGPSSGSSPFTAWTHLDYN